MSNLLSAERIETILIPVRFDSSSKGVANFILPFTPEILQISVMVDCPTEPAISTLVLFNAQGKNIAANFTNSAMASGSNPVTFKGPNAKIFNGQLEVFARDFDGGSFILTGVAVFSFTLIK